MKTLRQAALFLAAVLTLLASASADNVTINSGTLSEVRLSVAQGTEMWSGVYGDAGGGVGVGNSSNTLFNWQVADAEYVYFNEESIDFESDWRAANASDMSDEYEFLSGLEASSNTFESTASVSSKFQSNPVNSTIAAETLNGTDDPHWKTAYVRQGNSSDGFFVGIVGNGTAYNGEEADFQAILPEQPYDSNPTTYNMWVELQPK